ncbi:hypothetical protein [Asticcacaulis sp. MM231]|uniref:hypothetical protein n=1 Tax=Asticcacaulis sp. MM231 TaxID=3157666 RepID=UPI0032D57B10
MNIILVIAIWLNLVGALPLFFLGLLSLLVFGDCGVAISPDEIAKCYSDQRHFVITSFAIALPALAFLIFLAYRIARRRNLNKS